jgi:hypothetical protein
LHLAEWISFSIFSKACKRCVVKFPMIKETYSCKWIDRKSKIFVLNDSKSMRHSFPQSAD